MLTITEKADKKMREMLKDSPQAMIRIYIEGIG